MTKNQPGYGNRIGIYIYIYMYIYMYLLATWAPILHWPAAGTWWSSDLTWILVEVILCGFLSSQYMFIMVIKNPPKTIGFQYYFIMKTGWWLGGITWLRKPPFLFPHHGHHADLALRGLHWAFAQLGIGSVEIDPAPVMQPSRSVCRKNRKWLKIHDYHMTGGITIQLYQLF